MIRDAIDVTAILRMGVYLLSRGDHVVYVGKSKCPLARIAAHRSLARKHVPAWLPIRGIIFDSAQVIPCHPDRINALERGLIDLYKPIHNTHHNHPGHTQIPLSDLIPIPPRSPPIFTRRL